MARGVRGMNGKSELRVGYTQYNYNAARNVEDVRADPETLRERCARCIARIGDRSAVSARLT